MAQKWHHRYRRDKFHEHIKHITLDGHAYMSAMWMMNQDVFKGFSPEHKKILTDFENLRGVTTAIKKENRFLHLMNLKNLVEQYMSQRKTRKKLL